MIKITILGGAKGIGGNVIALATPNTKILLDLGGELNNDLATEQAKLAQINADNYAAAFISHYHPDHLALAYQLPQIPLYIGQMAYQALQAADNYKGQAPLKPAGFFSNQQTITIGDFIIKTHLADHSAFDSYMFEIKAAGQTIVYSGDFRSNGRKSFAKLLAQLPQQVDVLICEGTTLSRQGYQSWPEVELEAKAVKLFQTIKPTAPIFILQSAMNIDRLVTMYRAAKQAQRIFLQDIYMADIVSSIGGSIPNPAFNDVFAFITHPGQYEALQKYPHRLGKAQIAKRSFVMPIRNSMLNYLHSLAKEMDFEGGLLVYSMWKGYQEKPEMAAFLAEIRKLGLRIEVLHSGGHADAKTIEQLINRLQPKRILPVHTENWEWFDGR